MSSKTRVPNKVQWGLLDIIAESKDAQVEWDKAMRVAERSVNPELAVILARLGMRMANIELKAKDAINGNYEE